MNFSPPSPPLNKKKPKESVFHSRIFLTKMLQVSSFNTIIFGATDFTA